MLCLRIPFNDVVLKPLVTKLTFLDQLDEKLAPLHDGEDPLLHVTSSGVSTTEPKEPNCDMKIFPYLEGNHG
jgi:hypothetical protein